MKEISCLYGENRLFKDDAIAYKFFCEEIFEEK